MAARSRVIAARRGEMGKSRASRGTWRSSGNPRASPEGAHAGRKEVAIPIGAVTKIGTLLIHLSLTRNQVKDLPLPVDID
jgi:hypothetical protein